MIYPIEPGWLKTSDTLNKRERRQRRRGRTHRDETVKRDGDPHNQEILIPDANNQGTFDLVA